MELNKAATLLFRDLILKLREKAGTGKDLADSLQVGQSTISRWAGLNGGVEITVKETTLLAIATLLGKSQQRVMLYLSGVISYSELVEEKEIPGLDNSEQIKKQLFFIVRQLETLKHEIQFCLTESSGVTLVGGDLIRDFIKSKGKDPDSIPVKEYLELAKIITEYEEGKEILIQVGEKSYVYLK